MLLSPTQRLPATILPLPFELSLDGDTIFGTVEELIEVEEELEEIPEHSQRAYFRDTRAIASSPVDVMETKTAYVFVADLPGVKSSDVNVQVHDGNIMTIRAKRRRGEKEKGEKEREKYIRLERRPLKFYRKFNLPAEADVDGIKSSLHDGVLTVTVPKRSTPEAEKPKVKEIPVQ